MNVKICGLTRYEDAALAVSLGAWALGFIFYEKSPRYVSPEAAARIIERLPKGTRTVGVFVNESAANVAAIKDFALLSMVQLHGDETPEYCASLGSEVIKALRPKTSEDLRALGDFHAVSAFLIDAAVDGQYGGTGVRSDWSLAQEAKSDGRIILSGGLNSDNVASAIAAVEPFAVDVSSGVEASPGIKDSEKLRGFFAAVSKG